MQTIKFESFDQVAEEYNFEEKPRYFICDCPACGEHEAFMYKNNPNFIKCSRENNCGETTRVTYQDEVKEGIKTSYTKNTVKIPEYIQIENVKSITYLYDHADIQTEAALNRRDIFMKQRNISAETLDKADMLFAPVNEIVRPEEPLLRKFNKEEFSDRNILIGIRNIKTNEVERLLMRSTEPLEKKELQITLKVQDAALFTSLGNMKSDIVVITEAYIDGLSVIDVNPGMHVLTCIGKNGKNQLKDYILENMETFKHKKVMLAFDNDVAGKKASNELLEAFKDELSVVEFEYPEDIKDLNEYLQIDKVDFSRQITKQIYGKETKRILLDKTMDLQEKSAEIHSVISKQVESIKNNPLLLKEYLDFSSQFYQYSAKNRLLIYLQREGAHFVQSFNDWKKMGYSVKKGEKGIKIRVRKEINYFKNEQGEIKRVSQATAPEKKQLDRGLLETFKKNYYPLSGTVFDISQTNIPYDDYPKLLPRILENTQNIPYDEIKDIIVDYASQEGIYVEFGNMGSSSANGFYRPDTHEIMISNKIPSVQQIKTLLHEISHARLHKNLQENPLPLSVIETEAETSAYIICKALGIDTEDYSIAYLAGYSDYEVADFEHMLNRVSSNSTTVISVLKPRIQQCIEAYEQQQQSPEIAPEQEEALLVGKQLGRVLDV